MSIYVIGDIQGCFASFSKLLKKIAFDKKRDRLWLCGDLVNRGPRSLDVLRFVRGLGDSAKFVLGNHDLHFIACAQGARQQRKGDTLSEILEAPDCDELVDWIRRKPLFVENEDWFMVHAGLHPAWSLSDARDFAQRGSKLLRKDDTGEVAAAMRSPDTAIWDGKATGKDAALSACAVMVRIRTCNKKGQLGTFDGEPNDAPEGFKPWFTFRKKEDKPVLFGHWSALGIHTGKHHIGLDSGCVWGRELTAIRLKDRKVFSQPAVD